MNEKERQFDAMVKQMLMRMGRPDEWSEKDTTDIYESTARQTALPAHST
jgi:hypothetical protein